MEDKKNQRTDPQQENRTRQNNTAADKDKDNAVKAHDQAEEDIENDAELSAHSPNDDLDESETARLGDGENPLV